MFMNKENYIDTRDKRNLTIDILINAVRSLDDQGAKHLVKELCERFYLLPNEESINEEIDKQEVLQRAIGFRQGVDYILKYLKL